MEKMLKYSKILAYGRTSITIRDLLRKTTRNH